MKASQKHLSFCPFFLLLPLQISSVCRVFLLPYSLEFSYVLVPPVGPGKKCISNIDEYYSERRTDSNHQP
ncbi:MAG: hypothetical protein D3910_03140, partial [Candidatus Electrothrix sp. ATG2]|nr:hypothetical protein [Candidatus Electrothrix sp. ATG2]